MFGVSAKAAGAVLFFVAVSIVDTAIAGEYSYGFGYSAEYSDNPRLVPNAMEDELTHILNAGFSANQNSRELDLRAQASAAYRNYQHNVFADGSLFGFNGALVWKPLPDVLHWTIEDVYTQVAANATVADTPANRVNANVLSTGPDLFWRIGPVQTLQLGGRYASTEFDTTDDAMTASSNEADNTRETGTVRWFYRSSPTTTFSVGYLAEDVDFDASAASALDFRRYETTVGFVNRIARNSVTLDLGKTRIQRDSQPEIEGALVRLSWLRELTSDATFSVTASRSLSDTAEELLATVAEPSVGRPARREEPITTDAAGGTLVNTSDIFVSKQFMALYTRRSGNSLLSISVFRSKRFFEIDLASDEDAIGGSAEINRPLTDTLSASAAVRYVETTFPTLQREDETTTAGVALQYRLTRTLSSGLAYTRQSRSSSDPGSEYAENRAVLSLSYNSIPTRW